jgi:FAD/FMN-containing dehydrogenase
MASRETTAIKDINKTRFEKFKKEFKGQLIRPGDPSYEQNRRVWNGMIDKHPALIARCSNKDDIVLSVNFARENDLVTAVRGGGHNVAGNAVCDGGIVIDLSRMKAIEVDKERRIATAEPGIIWGEFDRATEPFGLVTTGGLISTTGIAGFTLGGGIGWVMRKFGLTCDNLVSAEIVTAEGQSLIASENENSDLFWGIRGGGGNFGIVSKFQFRLHPISNHIGSLIIHPFDKAGDLLRCFNEYINEIPDEISPMLAFLTAPPAPFLPKEVHGQKVVAILSSYIDQNEKGERALRKLREWGRPIADLTAPMPYTAWQSMLDADAPAGFQNYWKSTYLNEISDDAIDAVLSTVSDIPSPRSMVHFQYLSGAVSRVHEDATAFAHRSSPLVLNIISLWDDVTKNEKNIEWTRKLYSAMEPFSTGGVYVNFLGEEGEDRVRAAYGPKHYQRLAALKKKYDPTNFFRLNQNIRPQG